MGEREEQKEMREEKDAIVGVSEHSADRMMTMKSSWRTGHTHVAW